MNRNYPFIRGKVTRQAHVGLPEGTVEEEYGRAGFFGGYAHFYRTEPPVAWTRIEGPLKPRAYDLSKISPESDWLTARKPILGNDDVRLLMASLTESMPYYFRNADADDLLFVHEGQGILESDFGPLRYSPGDYLLIPRGCIYRLVLDQPSAFLVIETRGALHEPDRGLLGEHAFFDPAMYDIPDLPKDGRNSSLEAENGEWLLRILHRGDITNVYYPHCPMNAVGWKGTATVKRINVKDMRPITSERYHLPPPVHATFMAEGAIVCSFLPRPLETGDETAMKVPFYHNNIDYDEVLFYHDGEFFSRKGIDRGMLTFHPQGINHGPQPGAAEGAKNKTHTNEVAVMLDAIRPLNVLCDDTIELKNYWASWSPKTGA